MAGMSCPLLHVPTRLDSGAAFALRLVVSSSRLSSIKRAMAARRAQRAEVSASVKSGPMRTGVGVCVCLSEKQCVFQQTQKLLFKSFPLIALGGPIFRT